MAEEQDRREEEMKIDVREGDQESTDRTGEENESTDAQQTDGRSWAIEGNDTSGYVGVDPEYRNYASETEKPYLTEADRQQMQELGLKTDVEREADSLQAEDQQLPHREDAAQDVEVAPAQGDAREGEGGEAQVDTEAVSVDATDESSADAGDDGDDENKDELTLRPTI